MDKVFCTFFRPVPNIDILHGPRSSTTFWRTAFKPSDKLHVPSGPSSDDDKILQDRVTGVVLRRQAETLGATKSTYRRLSDCESSTQNPPWFQRSR
ncbi:hypothetical protein LshimejAT787_0501230 [Lyophyllum shimeji]|uniref:Uncharacterized protein n=1 Tax=Lyophyllum shimeji TaxID=47721 RepID=A0A9P3UM31_LYOSH|nr:hypothetical protein LshimejAT787_0501230 [Lyophyllum shimeji]